MLLALARTVSFIYFLPFFKGGGFLQMPKVAISLGISIFAAFHMKPVVIESLWELAGLAILEVIVGVTLALVVETVISVVRVAGSFIDLDIGMANPFPDMSNSATTVMATIFYSIFVLILFATDGFSQMLSGFIYTFGLDISTQLLAGGDMVDFILELFTYMFFGALQIALPFMMASLIVNLSFLLMAKTVDKINVLQNIFGIKILVGIFLVCISVPTLMIVFEQLGETLLEKFLESLNYMFLRRS